MSLTHILARIRDFEEKYQRPSGSVKLLAMSKGQSLEKIKEVIAAGQICFGENYLQEALSKMAVLKEFDLEWHFTGHIQSNKTRAIAQHFAWVHTVCQKKIAQRLNDQRSVSLLPLNICIEVNVSQEASKSGVRDMAELRDLAEYCQRLPQLKLRGLMAIPEIQSTLAKQGLAFHQLAKMKEQLCQQGFVLDTLSMGMTADMEAAIAEGATIIRVGRGIFSSRHYST